MSDRVVMTILGERQLIHKWSPLSARVKTGRLVGWDKTGRYMRIRRDKHKSVDTYHPSFWRLVE